MGLFSGSSLPPCSGRPATAAEKPIETKTATTITITQTTTDVKTLGGVVVKAVTTNCLTNCLSDSDSDSDDVWPKLMSLSVAGSNIPIKWSGQKPGTGLFKYNSNTKVTDINEQPVKHGP